MENPSGNLAYRSSIGSWHYMYGMVSYHMDGVVWYGIMVWHYVAPEPTGNTGRGTEMDRVEQGWSGQALPGWGRHPTCYGKRDLRCNVPTACPAGLCGQTMLSTAVCQVLA